MLNDTGTGSAFRPRIKRTRDAEKTNVNRILQIVIWIWLVTGVRLIISAVRMTHEHRVWVTGRWNKSEGEKKKENNNIYNMGNGIFFPSFFFFFFLIDCSQCLFWCTACGFCTRPCDKRFPNVCDRVVAKNNNNNNKRGTE